MAARFCMGTLWAVAARTPDGAALKSPSANKAPPGCRTPAFFLKEGSGQYKFFPGSSDRRFMKIEKSVILNSGEIRHSYVCRGIFDRQRTLFR